MHARILVGGRVEAEFFFLSSGFPDQTAIDYSMLSIRD